MSSTVARWLAWAPDSSPGDGRKTLSARPGFPSIPGDEPSKPSKAILATPFEGFDGASPTASGKHAPESETWITSSTSTGDLRLIVQGDPAAWTDAVFRCVALVEVLDVRTRADRADAQEIADQLELILAELRREGVTAWLAS